MLLLWDCRIKYIRLQHILYRYFCNRNLFSVQVCAKKGWKISSMDMMVILMICIILFFNNANIAHGSMVELVYTVAIFLFYIFGHRYLDWKPYMLGIQKYIGIFYACMTIYTVVNPAFLIIL